MSAATATEPKPATVDEPSRKIEDASPETIAAAQEEWINRQFPITKKAVSKPAEKPKETEEEKKAREDVEANVKAAADLKAKAEADTKAAKEEKPDKPKKKPVADLPPATVPPAPAVDEEAIAERVAEKVAQAKAPKVELTPAEQEALRTLEQMEKSDPRYKGIAGKTKEYWAKETAYIEKWQEENPEETFDPDAREHVAFYKKHTPVYDEDDFKMAERTVLKEELRQDLTKERKETETVSEARQQLQQAEPEIMAMRDAAVANFVRLSQPEEGVNYAKLVGDASVLTPEIEAKLEEADPIAKHILVEEGEPMAIMLAEFTRLTGFPSAYPLRRDAAVELKHSQRIMYPHAELMSFMAGLERRLVSRPPEETARDGKRLITNAQFAGEIKAISENRALTNAQKQQQIQQFGDRYYALNDENFRDAIVGSYASKAKTRIEQIRKLVGGSGSAEKKTAEGKAEGKASDAKPAAERGKSPSVAAASDNVDTRSPGTISAEEKTEFFAQRTFGG